MADKSAVRKIEHSEHVLLRPEMYIGSVNAQPCTAWVLSSWGPEKEKDADRTMVQRELMYSPGLLKVFDEIVVNAVDHATRTRMQSQGHGGGSRPAKKQKQKKNENEDDDGMSVSSDASSDALQVVKKIEVSIDRESGVIEVSNDGDGIAVERHSDYDNVYVPELIFGHMLTSTNYDDDEGGGSGRTVGGQNGIGAKACNIMSDWFEVEVIDRVRHLKYRQRFEANMKRALPPKVERSAAKRSRTTLRFLPDYLRLGMTDGKLSDDMHALMVRRVHDATAVTEADVAVWLDGVKLETKSFERYVDLYVGGRSSPTARPKAYERLPDGPNGCAGWEVTFSLLSRFEELRPLCGLYPLASRRKAKA